MATLHYTSGGTASEVVPHGFNLVEVQSKAQLDALPEGTMGLFWLNESDGVTSSFINKVTPVAGHPKLFGFFLVDEPDPTGRWGTYATAADLKAESDWIHTHSPGAKTFITMMNIGSYSNPDYKNTYNPANTGIDYYGINPYPVRTNSADFTLIDRQVGAALDSGIPLSKIVPVYQTFGGGDYRTDTGDKYVLPTTTQMQTMLDRWSSLVPNPAFDYAYAWGSQQGSTTLESSTSLQQVFREHNSSDVPVDDILYGTTGGDTLAGHDGNDTYYVNHSGDKVIEAVGEGSDKVLASVSHALAAGSEVEALATTNAAGKGSINLTGNAFAQTISGNAGDNALDDGGAGAADTMKGAAGNDHYYVRNSGDIIVEGMNEGTSDWVSTSVSYRLAAGVYIERVTTTNSAGTSALELTGNAIGQSITGNKGANVLSGKAGNDKLTGALGNDTFVFDTALNASTNVDVITDFANAAGNNDRLRLDDAIFTGLALGNLALTAFKDLALGIVDGDDRIIYDKANGDLFFDQDGSGASFAMVKFADLANNAALTSADFMVV